MNFKFKDWKGEPTASFQQFVQSIVSGYQDFSPDHHDLLNDGAARHWLPYYMQCNPCNKEYSPISIIKLDTWIRDTKAFLNISGVDPNRFEVEYDRIYKTLIGVSGHMT